MSDLASFLNVVAVNGLISGASQIEAAARFDLTFGEVESVILELGLCPARYQRNRQTISCGDQLTLLQSTVAVVGCGGLGGYIIEQLARLGVGQIVAIDPDVFEEHNLNRQILATVGNIGTPKVAAAAARVSEINPAVSLNPRQVAFSAANGSDLLRGCCAVVDALDNIVTRFELAGVCREAGIPLVHGAIAGWYGQVATQSSGEDISAFLSGGAPHSKGVETRLGNPAFTPAAVASLQVAEVCKVLLGRGATASGRLLVMNFLDMEFEEIRL